jgi:DNA-binding NarL/FixJ family response regulator
MGPAMECTDRGAGPLADQSGICRLRSDGAVTVVVGCTDRLVERGLRSLLGDQPRMRVLASDPEAAELERAVGQLGPQVVIVDETVELEVLRTLRASPCAPGVLVVARDPSRLFATMLGAVGARLLTLAASGEDVLAAVRSVADEAHGTAAARHPVAAPGACAAAPLTRRETTVFEHLRLGRTYVEIGLALHIAPETARTHTMNICRKLDVQRKRELIGYALVSGASLVS